MTRVVDNPSMDQIRSFIEDRLRQTQGRDMFRAREVQDMLLDLLLLCPEVEVPEPELEPV